MSVDLLHFQRSRSGKERKVPYRKRETQKWQNFNRKKHLNFRKELHLQPPILKNLQQLKTRFWKMI